MEYTPITVVRIMDAMDMGMSLSKLTWLKNRHQCLAPSGEQIKNKDGRVIHENYRYYTYLDVLILVLYRSISIRSNTGYQKKFLVSASFKDEELFDSMMGDITLAAAAPYEGSIEYRCPYAPWNAITIYPNIAHERLQDVLAKKGLL